MATDLNSQLIARQLQGAQPQGANPVLSGLNDVKTAGSIAKLAKPFLGGNTLGGFLGPGLGQVGGSLAGDVIPGVGAALGLYNMIQNKGNLSNIMSGAGTGASIGSMIVPGLGTLVGGGLGALAGGVEDLFNIGKPSQTELQGRDANGSIQSMMSQQATPAEMAEARQAVASGAWKDINGPLQIITTKDALMKQGMDPALADQTAQSMVKNTWNAEGQGGSAVQKAASTIPQSAIQQMMASRQSQPTQGSAVTPSSTGQSSPSPLPYTTDAFSSGAINQSRPTIPGQSSNFIF